MPGSFVSQFDPAHGKRAEFGELVRQSGRMLNKRSLDQVIGAENLLAKAMAGVAAGDQARAEPLIKRAAAMPYDPREEGSPGVRGATMMIYRLVSDQFEASGEDDPAWLDVALDVHARIDGPGQAELASVVHGFVLQEALYSLSSAEERRIRQAVGHAPLEADLGDGPDLTVERRHDVIKSLVAAAIALDEAYEARASQSLP